MLKITKIKDENGTGEYSIFHSPDFEFVNPVEDYSTDFIGIKVSSMKDFLLQLYPHYPVALIEKVAIKRVSKDLQEKLKEIKLTKIPDNLIAILTAKSKKDQVKMLKGLSINLNQLLSFIFRSYNEFGFLYSQYTAEHQHKGLDINKMPKLVEIKDDKVKKVGQTTLTDGQLKQAVDHRKRIVSKFLDKKEEWHCLFLTFDSLNGKESWKDGQPHFHYISDKFGISREQVIKELKSNRYKLGNLPHIDIIGYRDKD